MITRLIEGVYRNSENRYEELYNIFLYNCGFQLLISKLSVGFDTYRSRNYDDSSQIKQKMHVAYPPSSKSFNRVGKPNQIWFYASDHWHACYAEMMPVWYNKLKEGECARIIISTWHVRQNIRVIIIPDLTGINEVCKQIDLSAYKADWAFWTYICDKFRTTTLQDRNIYEFTSAFSNALMDRATAEGLNIEGLLYPSVQYPLKSNIALKPQCVDTEKIVLKNICKMEFIKQPGEDGLPLYIENSDPVQGFYEPGNDIISW